jgi:hypothetical protein
MKTLYFLYFVPKLIDVPWEERGINAPPPQYFFLLKNSFLFATDFKRAKRNWDESGGKG